jgi:fatty acid desaturase
VSTADYIRVQYADPHVTRELQILSAHPELGALGGPRASSGAWVVVLVATQIAMAVALGTQSWHIRLPLAYVAGATIDYALCALIHDCAHNPIFSARFGNRAAALTANRWLVAVLRDRDMTLLGRIIRPLRSERAREP